MNRIMKAALFTLILLFFHLQAMGAETSRIGVLDMQKFQQKSRIFQGLRAELKKKFDGMQKKLDQEMSEVQKIEEELEKQSMMLSLDAQQLKKQELEKKKRHLKYLREEYTYEMKDAERDVTQKISKDLEKIVKKMAEKEGFSIILERRTIGLIFFNDALEITDKVVEAYDKAKQ